ncbi:DUF2769 domain-containing protein [Methanoregula sp. PtaU1.Bin006]|uniref:DUF2769 domain-containing protein n=2 Tax=unclassified Methanoregula TaxID=2649730 RepID=UPI0025DCB04E|nr:DUF2769 domain-containing protein [Methanoregula sp. PtaU1.Bin006]
MDRPGRCRAGRGMMAGTAEQLIRKNRARCICGTCPTYNECMRAAESLLFCVVGKAENCTFDPKDCLCPTCPVIKTLGLKRAFSCIRGSAADQG